MHKEFEFIRDICKQNGYSDNFVQCQTRHTLNRHIEKQNKLNKLCEDSKMNKSEPKQDETNETYTDKLILNAPFVGKATQQFTKDIKKLTKKVKSTTKLITIPRPPSVVGRLFKNKDEIPEIFRSHVVYQLNCSTYSAKYIGKTVKQARRRLKEHGAPLNIITIQPSQALRRSARVSQNNRFQICYTESDSNEDEELNLQTTSTSAIKRHMLTTDHKIDWKDWSILDVDKHLYRLLIKESIAIVKNSPSLNHTTRSVPLIVYPDDCMTIRMQLSINFHIIFVIRIPPTQQIRSDYIILISTYITQHPMFGIIVSILSYITMAFINNRRSLFPATFTSSTSIPR